MLEIDGCDPELRLCLGSSCADSRSTDTTTTTSSSRVTRFGSLRHIPQEQRQQQQQQQQQKQLTIFYNGQICVCDVTEIQAKAIITVARREIDERMMVKNDRNQLLQEIMASSSSLPVQLSPPPPLPASQPAALQQLLINNSGLSMKRSLQRFLQKRKVRLDAASPYNTHTHHQLLLFPVKS